MTSRMCMGAMLGRGLPLGLPLGAGLLLGGAGESIHSVLSSMGMVLTCIGLIPLLNRPFVETVLGVFAALALAVAWIWPVLDALDAGLPIAMLVLATLAMAAAPTAVVLWAHQRLVAHTKAWAIALTALALAAAEGLRGAVLGGVDLWPVALSFAGHPVLVPLFPVAWGTAASFVLHLLLVGIAELWSRGYARWAMAASIVVGLSGALLPADAGSTASDLTSFTVAACPLEVNAVRRYGDAALPVFADLVVCHEQSLSLRDGATEQMRNQDWLPLRKLGGVHVVGMEFDCRHSSGCRRHGALVAGPEAGMTGRYDKRLLVPGIETGLPLQTTPPSRHWFEAGQQGFRFELRSSRARIGIEVLVCWESLSRAYLAAAVRAGARLVANPSSDAWARESTFGPAYLKSLMMLRASEFDLAIVRVSSGSQNQTYTGVALPGGRWISFDDASAPADFRFVHLWL